MTAALPGSLRAPVVDRFFVLAALVKSAQLRSPRWIGRALEGPDAVVGDLYGSLMVHAGIYLLCRLQGLLAQVPDLMLLLAVVCLLTAAYGLCVLVQATSSRRRFFRP